jgi:hypothetical protein
MEDRSMPLIGSDALLARFNHLVGTSTHVDIAVAWAGPGLAVELLLENVHDTEVRVVVGLSGNSTEPATLRRLMAEDSVARRAGADGPACKLLRWAYAKLRPSLPGRRPSPRRSAIDLPAEFLWCRPGACRSVLILLILTMPRALT